MTFTYEPITSGGSGASTRTSGPARLANDMSCGMIDASRNRVGILCNFLRLRSAKLNWERLRSTHRHNDNKKYTMHANWWSSLTWSRATHFRTRNARTAHVVVLSVHTSGHVGTHRDALFAGALSVHHVQEWQKFPWAMRCTELLIRTWKKQSSTNANVPTYPQHMTP